MVQGDISGSCCKYNLLHYWSTILKLFSLNLTWDYVYDVGWINSGGGDRLDDVRLDLVQLVWERVAVQYKLVGIVHFS